MNVNKVGQDWRLIRFRLVEMIDAAHSLMELGLTVEEYQQAVGRVAMARELIEWVEPTTPAPTLEDDYGISDPSE
jgi:hypothetical protein